METTTIPAVVDTIQEQVDKASSFFTDITNYFLGILPLLIIAIMVLVVGVLLSRLVARIISKTLQRSNVEDSARSFLVSVIRTALYVLVIIMALSVLNVPMSSIITVLGAAGLAVSLALQNCLTNLCGGFIILFSKPFTAGDMVELDGITGNVESIGVLYTKLNTKDGKSVLIPNGSVSNAKLINYTETPTRRVDLKYEISYSADYRVARQLIVSVVSENEMILSDPAPVVRMASHNDSSIAIDVLVWVANENYNEVRYTLNETVKQIFDRNNIEIPFNQLDVHIIGEENVRN
ncbi:MAG: mechanosensitive ion channel [Ruminococcus flavefaciens]|nr:mechanosensitive ion channel [Ruminococcus flavefaciens]MCM1229809.1 mechanosensitive ion channel [Ruminococcus flavefaciens]